MDGSQSLFAEVKNADEAARQAQVYARAMESIRKERAAQERQGYVVMSAMTSTEDLQDSLLMTAVRMFLIGFACVMPVIAMWTIAL